MSTKAKIANWWYYYKWWVIVGTIVFISLIPVFKNLLRIGIVEPDYCIAVVTAAGISEGTAEELSAALEQLGTDLNGDGEVVVEVKQYSTGAGDQETVMYYGYASTITIQADIAENDSHFFLVDDPEKFQIAYQILADEAGKLPADDDFHADGRYVPFSALKLTLSEGASAELAPLFAGQRGYFREEEVPHLAEYQALWRIMTGGSQ